MQSHEFSDEESELRAAIASHPASGSDARLAGAVRNREGKTPCASRLYRLAHALRDASEHLGYDGPLFPPTDH